MSARKRKTDEPRFPKNALARRAKRVYNYNASQNDAEVAQLVEHWLPKPRVAGSNPVFRSSDIKALGDFLLELF